ncbi:carbohydrate ABC transporter permease [Enterococcus faecium]|uniref:Sugar ABC transporter permease n=1 Tax=Enterococcus faecium TaxID=1352 RepID=A0A7V7GNI9_ENTFC|nr:sugar ABC transporter permease [Enterococcus faecium]KAA0691120.1 sugar ABC transporter permease [Enterococcus faecium]MBK5027953.1 sugar ABC transporter permease [Enterococcus faecium]MBK5038622.1 sugar ABC transporter permease [Enterococcus faecium]MBK5043616.1 sugar ABC transporter permease [Enterococcus faecium]MBK5068618.1 sugar ABC transporter permease [Enterococcus faecium]
MNGFTKYWNRPERAAYLFLTPSFLVLLLFTVIPLLGTFAISFTDLNIFFTSRNFVSFENFTRIFSDERAVNSLIHSLYFTVLETPTQIIVGLLAAVVLSKNTRFNRFCRSTFYIPVICSLTSIAIIFSMLLDPNVGAIPYLFSQVGLPIPQFFRDPTLAMPTVAIMTVWKNFGVTMTILLTAIQGISPSLYESAQMDGATNRQQFFNITLPQIVPSLGFCVLTNLIGSMQVFDQVYVATAGGPQFKTETAVQYIYSRGFTAPYELGYASALSSVLFIIVATIAISTNLYMSRKEKQMK